MAAMIRIAIINPAPIPYWAKKSSAAFDMDTPEYCSQTITSIIPTTSAPRRCPIHLNSIPPCCLSFLQKSCLTGPLKWNRL